MKYKKIIKNIIIHSIHITAMHLHINKRWNTGVHKQTNTHQHIKEEDTHAQKHKRQLHTNGNHKHINPSVYTNIYIYIQDTQTDA